MSDPIKLPFGFENRHNAVDPTAAVFAKAECIPTQQQRDEAVRQKYLANSKEGSGINGSNGLPVGWSERKAASDQITSPAAVPVDWSAAAREGGSVISESGDRSEVAHNTEPASEPGHRRGALPTESPIEKTTDSQQGSTQAKMATIVFRLHEIARKEQELALERKELLQQLSMAVVHMQQK